MAIKNLCISVFLLLITFSATAQVNENKTGAWYLYIFNAAIKETKFGLQGDLQYRNWNIAGDLEQLILRGGVNYNPNSNIQVSMSYAHIISGAYGDSNASTIENRLQQDILLPHKISGRIYLKHRFRYEQRWVEDQDFRTRYRYNLFVNVPLNKKDFSQNAIYLAFYNEVFLNGQRAIGNGKTVEIFDRNWLYGGLGYAINDKLKLQLGFMEHTSNNFSKGQLQVSLHHNF